MGPEMVILCNRKVVFMWYRYMISGNWQSLGRKSRVFFAASIIVMTSKRSLGPGSHVGVARFAGTGKVFLCAHRRSLGPENRLCVAPRARTRKSSLCAHGSEHAAPRARSGNSFLCAHEREHATRNLFLCVTVTSFFVRQRESRLCIKPETQKRSSETEQKTKYIARIAQALTTHAK